MKLLKNPFPRMILATGKPGVKVFRRGPFFPLAAVGLFLAGLLAGVYLFFPAKALKQWLIYEFSSRVDAKLQIERVTVLPPLSLNANKATITIANPVTTSLEVDTLTVTPQWSSLLTGNPGIAWQAKLLDGITKGWLLSQGALQAEAEGLRFDLTVQKPLSCTVTGTIHEARFESVSIFDPAAESSLQVTMSDVKILGLAFAEPGKRDFALGEVRLEATSQNRVVRINSLLINEGELDVNGSGRLLISRSAPASRIKIDLSVRPNQTSDPSFTPLLEAFNKPDQNGWYPFELTGTLAAPYLRPGS